MSTVSGVAISELSMAANSIIFHKGEVSKP